jgi:hypothetical protein
MAARLSAEHASSITPAANGAERSDPSSNVTMIGTMPDERCTACAAYYVTIFAQ